MNNAEKQILRKDLLKLLEDNPFSTTTVITEEINKLYSNNNWTRSQIFNLLKGMMKDNLVSYEDPKESGGPTTKGDPYEWGLISYFQN